MAQRGGSRSFVAGRLARLLRGALFWWVTGLVAIALGVGHVAYWYAPRLVTDRPDPGTLTAAMLSLHDMDHAVWVARPHQNLPAALDVDLERTVRDVASLYGVRELPTLRFGPFSPPPSRSLAVAWGPGGRWAAAIELYPTAALLARALGGLGTTSEHASGIEARWSGTTLVVHRGLRWQDLVETREREGVPSVEGAQAVWTTGVVPNRRTHGIAVGEAAMTLSPAHQGAFAAAAPSLPEGVDLVLREGGADGRGLLFVLSSEGELPRGHLRLPSSVALGAGEQRWPLALESLRERLRLESRHEVHTADSHEITIHASDDRALDAGRHHLSAFASTALSAAPDGWQLAVRVDGLLTQIQRSARTLAELPLLSEEEARNWSVVHRLTLELEGFSSLELVSSGAGMLHGRLELASSG